MDDDSEEIYTTGLLKRYCKRPPKLENLTLADWAAWYDNCSSKPYVKETHEIDIDGLPLEKYIDDEQNDDDDEFVKTTNSKTRRHSKARVLRNVWFNKQKEPEKHYRELLMLFTPWVIVKKSSPKNLSADCRSTVGRQLANRWPTGFARNIGYLSADSGPTVGRLLVMCQ